MIDCDMQSLKRRRRIMREFDPAEPCVIIVSGWADPIQIKGSGRRLRNYSAFEDAVRDFMNLPPAERALAKIVTRSHGVWTSGDIADLWIAF
jgi:hypothetical protein